MKTVGLDVDDVLAAFTPHVHAFFGQELQTCNYWCKTTMDGKFGENWFTEKVAGNEDFWQTLPVLSPASDINFQFHYYISAFPEEVYTLRLAWLKHHGYPERPLISCFDKLEKCIDLGIDVLVDDKPETIMKLQGSPVKGIHFITPYAGFDPIGEYITNLKQVKQHL